MNKASWDTGALRIEDIRPARSTEFGRTVGDILPGMVSNVKRHKGEVIQMFPPNVLPQLMTPLSVSGPFPFSSSTAIGA